VEYNCKRNISTNKIKYGGIFMGAAGTYNYIKKLLVESGIDFKNIDKNDILTTCANYKGEINNNNFILTLKVINDIYESDK
jgi:hypothetical protein